MRNRKDTKRVCDGKKENTDFTYEVYFGEIDKVDYKLWKKAVGIDPTAFYVIAMSPKILYEKTNICIYVIIMQKEAK